MWSQPTHGDRIGLAVQRLNHSATMSVQSWKYEIFLSPFLISVDFISDRPVDAPFWSEIDYWLFFLSWLFIWKLMKNIFNGKIDK